MLTVTWFFLPYAMDDLVSPLVTLWAIISCAVIISAISRNKNGKVRD